MDKCIVDKQEIDRKMVFLPKMLAKTSCEQEECVGKEICDMFLPKLFKAEEGVHTDEIELKMPEINAVEIKELPRKIKSKLHSKWKKVLTSRRVRRTNPTEVVKREICRLLLSHQTGKIV